MKPLIKDILKACAIYTNPIHRKFEWVSLGHLGQRYNIYSGIIDHVPSKSELVNLGKALDKLLTQDENYIFHKLNNKVVDSMQGNFCFIQSLHAEYITDWPEEGQLGGYVNVIVSVSYNELNKLGNVTVTISSDLD